MRINTYLSAVLDLAFPQVCHFCGTSKINSDIDLLCSKCASEIPFRSKDKRYLKCLEEYFMIKNGLTLSDNFWVIAGCYYEDPIRHALVNMKFHDESYHRDEFASILARIISEEKIKSDYIIPLPLHKLREKERGYNQTKLVADKLSEKTEIEIMHDLLCRVRETKRQSEVGGKEDRMMNIQDAFVCQDIERIVNKSIILLDDVLTSGATMFNAAQSIIEGFKSYKNNSFEIKNLPRITGLVIASDR